MASRQVVLIRGINVGRNRRLPMAQLRALCESVGCSDVSTYIQSGNVVVDSGLSARRLASRLEDAIAEAAGFAPRVVVRTPKALADVLASNPFPDAPETTLHVGFMSAPPAASAVEALGGVDYRPEEFVVRGAELYLHLPNGLGRSKLGAVPFERLLGVAITIRNWRTVTKLHKLATR